MTTNHYAEALDWLEDAAYKFDKGSPDGVAYSQRSALVHALLAVVSGKQTTADFVPTLVQCDDCATAGQNQAAGTTRITPASGSYEEDEDPATVWAAFDLGEKQRTESQKFGHWLSAQMKLFGIPSDSALARALDVRDTTVGRWRKGTSTPDIPQLRRIAALFNTRLAHLVVFAGHLTAEELRPVPPSADEPNLAPFKDQDEANEAYAVLQYVRERYGTTLVTELQQLAAKLDSDIYQVIDEHKMMTAERDEWKQRAEKVEKERGELRRAIHEYAQFNIKHSVNVPMRGDIGRKLNRILSNSRITTPQPSKAEHVASLTAMLKETEWPLKYTYGSQWLAGQLYNRGARAPDGHTHPVVDDSEESGNG